MRLTRQQVEFFRSRVARSQALALLLVIETEGSTYSKVGQAMFADADGAIEGMLSGGCLENDLAERARAAIGERSAHIAEYDLVRDDELFGLGVGCEGVMRILIQPLDAGRGYAPMSGVLQALKTSASVTVDFGRADNNGAALEVGNVAIERPRHLLLLGGGLDADPLIDFAATIGWDVTVVDHRPATVERLGRNDQCRVIDLDELDSGLLSGLYDAAIVKTHNLQRDREYLGRLAASPVPFVGLLGPPHRRDRILGEMPDAARVLNGRLHAPVGRRIGGRGPGPVALEIVAELQAFFSED